MSGSILDLARRDSKHFVTNGGFEEDIVITTPDKTITQALTGYATKHFYNYDSDGLPINTKNVHICIDENVLTNAGYPVRNTKDEVSLLNHFIDVKDSTGLMKHYTVRENWPDETLGLIVCVLNDHVV